MSLTEQVFQSFSDEQKATVIGKSNNKGKTDLYRALRVILVDQYVSWRTDPTLCTAIQRGRNTWIVGSRYNGMNLPHRTSDVIDILIEQGLLHKANHSYNRTGSSIGNRSTRIQPTDKLAGMFEHVGLELHQLQLHEEQETIILRMNDEANDDKAIDIPYKDNALTRRMRKEVEAYNAMMLTHYVDVASLTEPCIYREVQKRGATGKVTQRVAVDASHKFCRRVFNRNSWKMNGRWNGGFWMQLPKEMRPDIYIDDVSTEEVDYSGLHPSILAWEQGQRLTGDRYDLGKLIDNSITLEEQRNVVKLLVLVAINARDRAKAFGAYNLKAAKPRKHNVLNALIDAFIEKYPFLEASLFTDQGIRLMNIDSQIATEVINTFVAKDIPILPVHDSFIVKRKNVFDLQTAMSAATIKVLGVDLEYESRHEGMMRKVTKQAMHTSDVVVMPFNLSDKTQEYKDRYKLWKEQ